MAQRRRRGSDGSARGLVLVAAVLGTAAMSTPVRAQSGTCGASHLGSDDGCDCGCGVLDADCGAAPVEQARCDYDACPAGAVPSAADVTVCLANVCGDGYRAGVEMCDDGNATSEGGCAPDCSHQELGWLCGVRGEGCRRERCGDGLRTVTERCDDGNSVAGDGCAADCNDEPGYICYDAQPCRRTVCGDAYAEFDTWSRSGETCDDGNSVAGDGCDRCEAEPGWYCPIWGGPCTEANCGDGVVQGDPYYRLGETCDDMNDDPNDGCDQCVAAPGTLCWNGPCHFVVCGDGLIDYDGVSALEQCDDGNAGSGDGCTSTCQMEPGFDCYSSQPGEPCIEVRCGDGIISYDQFGYPEMCDDGNELDGDGCSAQCDYREPGFVCETPGEPCREPVCGDGQRDRDLIYGTVLEECDDGNTTSGDGCSEECSPEPGFECVAEGAPCVALPDGWECSVSFFGVGDGCDCGCGRPDPDCSSTDVEECAFNHCFEEPEDELDPCDPTRCVTDDDVDEAEEEGCPATTGDPIDALRCDARSVGEGADAASVLALSALGALLARRRR
ncbi:MAG: DUF4215 domain-containing protein [Deltaproteobacteria bacterium]|nr:DUF4215 domain-containing protein [Deltaproteobacteria bacterium]